jgi:hypothetical protein
MCVFTKESRKRKPGREGFRGDDRGVSAWDADEESPQLEPREVLFGGCPKKESGARGINQCMRHLRLLPDG